MKDLLLCLAALIIIFFAFINSIKYFFKRYTIFEYERGLLYSGGKFVKILPPGQYLIFTFTSYITKIDIRTRFETITGQEVISSDGVTLKVSIGAKYEITDPHVSVNKVQNYQGEFYLIMQMALREIAGNTKIDDIIEKRNILGDKLMEISSKKFEEIGLKLISADIKDIMFPGELKKIFCQVVKAQKEGQAVLEKVRGETAALRNLLNAAKMVEENPSLLQLRLIQSLGESSGNTVVLNMSDNSLILKEKSGKSKIEKDYGST
jgi:regulator of protease activity HflC (stomatin/prohibitin superfamily)